MNSGWRTHFLNKWPGSNVIESDSSFNVYAEDGRHVVAMVKNGAGQWVDKSEEFGLVGRFCLSPIPRDSRVHKVVGGKQGFDEQADERREAREHFLGEHGEVQSCEVLAAAGWEFDKRDQSVKRAPAEQAQVKAKR